MLPSFCTQTIKRERAPFKTERGSEVRDWNSDAVDIKTIGGCSVQTASVVRDFTRSENVQKGMTLFAPPTADIQLGDRIVFQGKRYEIDGEPYVWVSPTNRVSSLQAHIKRWKG